VVTNVEPQWCRELLPAARLMLRRRRGPAGEDFAQQALLVLLEAIRAGKVKSRDEAGAFLHGVCRNLLRADARLQARRDELLDRNVTVFADSAHANPMVDRDRLHACLNQLTARSRDVVLRSFVDDQDAPEIAASLDLSPENVRVIRFRALLALRECMTGEAP
jgi:RNA polymerase sigma factor (sigma-70 family)